jgi:hypothetical protein
VRRKLGACHRHIQIGLIAQGLLQCLAIHHPRLVWSSFDSWLRTIRPGVAPSELVTAAALRNWLPDFSCNEGTSRYSKNSYANSGLPNNRLPCDSPDTGEISTLKKNRF